MHLILVVASEFNSNETKKIKQINQWENFRYTFKNLSLNKRVAHFIHYIKSMSCCIRWLDLKNLSLREIKSERENVYMQENLMGMGNS